MKKMRRSAALAGMAVMGIVGILLMVKFLRPGRQAGMYEKVGRGIDEKLLESKAALERATAHVQNVVGSIKNHKP